MKKYIFIYFLGTLWNSGDKSTEKFNSNESQTQTVKVEKSTLQSARVLKAIFHFFTRKKIKVKSRVNCGNTVCQLSMLFLVLNSERELSKDFVHLKPPNNTIRAFHAASNFHF